MKKVMLITRGLKYLQKQLFLLVMFGVCACGSYKKVSKATDIVNGHGAVDLGLSVKWATCNVGASSPSGYGDYFAWGETRTKSSYTGSNSTTNNLSYSELQSRGIIDTDGNLTASYDAATTNWGTIWRMPTLDEIKELLKKCTWNWITYNGVEGYLVTGPNGNSIFLPAANFYSGTALCSSNPYRSVFYNTGSDGYYWSATANSVGGSAYNLNVYSNDCGWYFYYRYFGHSVRPVTD